MNTVNNPQSAAAVNLCPRSLRACKGAICCAILYLSISGCNSTKTDGSSLVNPRQMEELPHVVRMSIEPGEISLFGPGHLGDPTSCSSTPWRLQQGGRFKVFGIDETYRYKVAAIHEKTAVFELEIDYSPDGLFMHETAKYVVEVPPFDIDKNTQ